MVEKAEITRKKCGEIFILSDDNISLICDFCADNSVAIEDFRHHIKDHFPILPMNIKCEDSISCDRDPETFPTCIDEKFKITDDKHYLGGPPCIIDEDFVSCGNENGYNNPLEQQLDDVTVNFIAIPQARSTEPDRTDFLYLETLIKTEPCERIQPNWMCELQWNSKNDNENSERVLNNDLDPCNQGNGSDIPKSRKRNTKCNLCCKIFTSKWHLNRHTKTHTGYHTFERPHKCHLCSRTFTKPEKLSKHIYATHEKTIQQHECSVCKKRFLVKTSLDRHIREKHLPETDPRRYFACKLCDDKYKTQKQLSIHNLRIHKKAKFTCDYCHREFNTRSKISNHILLHSGTKNYRCQYCKKRFAQANGKWSHERYCQSK